MASDQEITLGKIITHENATRDAVHIAIFPAVAGTPLLPGQEVSFFSEDDMNIVAGFDDDDEEYNPTIGIVDPFLQKKVKKGQRFWVFLFPNTITSLRHVWEHPMFSRTVIGPEKEPSASEQARQKDAREWITCLAAKMDIGYDELMAAADRFAQGGYYTMQNSEKYKDVWDQFPTFWRHYEVIRGPQEADMAHLKDEVPFTCSC